MDQLCADLKEAARLKLGEGLTDVDLERDLRLIYVRWRRARVMANLTRIHVSRLQAASQRSQLTHHLRIQTESTKLLASHGFRDAKEAEKQSQELERQLDKCDEMDEMDVELDTILTDSNSEYTDRIGEDMGFKEFMNLFVEQDEEEEKKQKDEEKEKVSSVYQLPSVPKDSHQQFEQLEQQLLL